MLNRTDRTIMRDAVAELRNRSRQAGWANDPAGWASDVLGVHMWSKQREIADSLIHHKRTVVASCHGTGKALAVDTPIPTPDGWTVMGDVRPGMQVLGSDGRPVNVVATTGVHTADRYVISLRGTADGIVTEITASGDHLWPVLDGRSYAMAALLCLRTGQLPAHSGLWHHRARIMDTRRIADMLGSRTLRLYVPARRPGFDPEGTAWEPDGWIAELLKSRGCSGPDGRTALEWITHHTAAPPEEMAGVRSWMKERGVHTQLHRRREGNASTWTLSLRGDHAALVSPHSDVRALAVTAQRRDVLVPDAGWEIISVRKISDGAVQCIQVDAEDNLFLCGESRIPTHNSMIASVLACWWISTRPVGEAIVVSTAPSYAQVNKILWEEIRKHHATAKLRGNPMVGYVTQGDEWKSDSGQVLAFGRKPPTGDRHGFHGIHRRYVLVVLDEACGLPEEIWTGVEAITTTDGCRIIAIGNPDDRNTEFGNAFIREDTAQDWNRISVPASSTPNFTGEEVPSLLNEVLVSRAWCEQRLRAWGDKDPRYISKVLAEFPEVSKSSLFPPALVAQAFDEPREQQIGSVVRLGVDVARFGTDRNVVVSYAGNTARIEDSWIGTDTVSSAHKVYDMAKDIKERLRAPWVEIRVDAVGLGAGVVDTLNARSVLEEKPWFSVFEMHGSASPPANVGGSIHGYGNARAYWYDQLKQSMRNGRVQVIDNPGREQEHETLKDELGIIFYKYQNGRLFIISKEEMRAKHGKSPDFADALAYATAPVTEELAPGTKFSDSAESLVHELDGDDYGELSISPY